MKRKMFKRLLFGAAIIILAMPFTSLADGIGVVVSRNAGGAIDVFDDSQVLGALTGFSGFPGDCVITPDATTALVTDWSNHKVHYIDLADPANPAFDGFVTVGNNPDDISLTPNGEFAVVCAVNGHSVDVIDVNSMTLEDSFSLGTDTCAAVEVCDDGSSVLMAQYNGTPEGIRRLLLDQSTGTLSDTFETLVFPNPTNLACAPGSNTGAAATQTGVVSFVIPGLTLADTVSGPAVQTVRIAPGGDQLFARYMTGKISAYPFNSSNGAIGVLDYDIAIPIGSNYLGHESFEIDSLGNSLKASIETTAQVSIFDTTDGSTIGTPLTVSPLPYGVCLTPFVDSDGDGVPDAIDICPDTVIPETAPTIGLKYNRYALTDGDEYFDTETPGGKTAEVYTVSDTGGCSCEQIADELGLGSGQIKFGCSNSVMTTWIDFVNQ